MEEDLKKCIEVLSYGGVILYPTDTVWGLGCDATNAEAVAKIFAIKQRDDSKALVTLVDSDGRLQQYVKEVPEVAWDLIDLSTKPITIVYDNAKGLATNVLAEDGSAALRIATDPFCKKLIQRYKRPIVSTSANISGEPTPSMFKEVSDELKAQVDFVVSFRQEDITPAQSSTVIKLGSGGQVKVLRE